ncbi:MAG: hypothetical protein OXH71_00180 [Candidatus Dadabacteria bacterium]|nr:hypothetical protein [Candidatus Dadabacteria bacterium]MDE0519118.1 hypothetical protein [Candidatus Dadabacteria bacterium]MDE0662685.1 hypothetical protein [Candidatus Dadabacteria bacterium]
MSKNDALDIVRKKMLELLEAGKFTDAWSKQQPVDWNPGKIMDPYSDIGLEFTHRSCWDFIGRLLRDKHPIEVTTLEKPPGEKGYEMVFETEPGYSDIYIKLQIGRDKLIGRSFHYSYRSK